MMKIKHSWRRLPFSTRLDIPTHYFGIDEQEIRRIRAISDSKTKLIESARLQYELYGDIHNDLTVWIAGYASDATIRSRFGSMLSLRNMIYPPPDTSHLKPSIMDIKRRISIPDIYNEDLAEEVGIHLGDGNLFIETHKDYTKSYQYSIHGNLLNETQYHREWIYSLLKKLYNYSAYSVCRDDKNLISTFCKSKLVVEFKSKILGLPIGSKKIAQIPLFIMEHEELQKRCLIGIFDTDFSLNKYGLSGSLTSLKVIKQMSYILKQQKIKHVVNITRDLGRIAIPKDGTMSIFEEWKMHNSKHLSKYQLYKEFGIHIPFSTTTERQAVLLGKLDARKLKKLNLKKPHLKDMVSIYGHERTCSYLLKT